MNENGSGNEAAVPTEAYGYDSTSVQDIQIVMTGDNGDMLGDSELYVDVGNYNSDILSDESLTNAEKLTAGLDLLERSFVQSNKAWNGVEGVFTDYAIEQGKTLHILKKLVKKDGGKWGVWAAENIKCMSERTRQDYMLLAEREDAHPYSWAGKQRLLLLISATKNMEGDDPIGDLLREYGIEIEVEGEMLLSEFKAQVDAALATSKVRKAGVNVDFEKMKGVIEVGVKTDNQFIKNLDNIQKSGGDPNNHLERLHMNQGQEENIFEPENRYESFVKLAAKMKSTITAMLRHAELAGVIDFAQVQSLEVKLAELKVFIASK